MILLCCHGFFCKRSSNFVWCLGVRQARCMIGSWNIMSTQIDVGKQVHKERYKTREGFLVRINHLGKIVGVNLFLYLFYFSSVNEHGWISKPLKKRKRKKKKSTWIRTSEWNLYAFSCAHAVLKVGELGTLERALQEEREIGIWKMLIGINRICHLFVFMPSLPPIYFQWALPAKRLRKTIFNSFRMTVNSDFRRLNRDIHRDMRGFCRSLY